MDVQNRTTALRPGTERGDRQGGSAAHVGPGPAVTTSPQSGARPMNPPSLPQAYPPSMGFQSPPDFDARPGTPWMVVGIFALLALAVGFAGGTGFGYVIGRGGPAIARAARDSRSDAERANATSSMV